MQVLPAHHADCRRYLRFLLKEEELVIPFVADASLEEARKRVRSLYV